MLLTPNKERAGDLDRVMLLLMWAKHLNNQPSPAEQNGDVIVAGIGKPTFPMSNHTVMSAISYWVEQGAKSQSASQLLSAQALNPQKTRNDIVGLNAACDYGHPQGEPRYRLEMAEAINNWYPNANFTEDDVLFTTGGVNGLHHIFEVLNRNQPNCRIVTPFPHYSLYTGTHKKNNLHPINVMSSPGYRLTAKALEEAILSCLEAHNELPAAFLLCDPSNPLGTLMSQRESLEIACVLRKYPSILIVLDEAYSEMSFGKEPHASLLRVAPDLKERIILLRSATKALSSAGERMAILVTSNKSLMMQLLQENIDTTGHAPISLQHVYSKTMLKLNSIEIDNLRKHYQPQVELVKSRLEKMGINMPDQQYKPEGTFYIIADLSELLGLKLPSSTHQALGKKELIETDEDIIYFLLFTQKIMLAPLSYFGADPKLGIVRITCGEGDQALTIMMDRIEKCLKQVRAHQSADSLMTA